MIGEPKTDFRIAFLSSNQKNNSIIASLSILDVLGVSGVLDGVVGVLHVAISGFDVLVDVLLTFPI